MARDGWFDLELDAGAWCDPESSRAITWFDDELLERPGGVAQFVAVDPGAATTDGANPSIVAGGVAIAPAPAAATSTGVDPLAAIGVTIRPAALSVRTARLAASFGGVRFARIPVVRHSRAEIGGVGHRVYTRLRALSAGLIR